MLLPYLHFTSEIGICVNKVSPQQKLIYSKNIALLNSVHNYAQLV